MPIFKPEIECASRTYLHALQSERLVKMVENAYNNIPFYKKKFDEMGLKPEDIKSIDDISKLPFTVKTDLRDNYPFGLFARPQSDIVRIHASSGTTGKATYPEDILAKLAEKDIKLVSLDALSLAIEAGTPKCANIVLLGAAVQFLGIDKEMWVDIIRSTVPPKTIDINLKAFELGYNAN